jgi:hypothetical protein
MSVQRREMLRKFLLVLLIPAVAEGTGWDGLRPWFSGSRKSKERQLVSAASNPVITVEQ